MQQQARELCLPRGAGQESAILLATESEGEARRTAFGSVWQAQQQMATILLLLAVAAALAPLAQALNNGAARTPPLGWLSWQRYRCNMNCTADPDNCFSEKLIKKTIDAMAAGGYKEAGYEYVNLDDCECLRMH